MPGAKNVQGLTEGRGLLASASAVNLSKLFADLVHPDRNLTAAEKSLAEAAMNEIAPGTKTENNPNYKHKGEGKPSVKKPHEHSGLRNRDNKAKKAPSKPKFIIAEVGAEEKY